VNQERDSSKLPDQLNNVSDNALMELFQKTTSVKFVISDVQDVWALPIIVLLVQPVNSFSMELVGLHALELPSMELVSANVPLDFTNKTTKNV